MNLEIERQKFQAEKQNTDKMLSRLEEILNSTKSVTINDLNNLNSTFLLAIKELKSNLDSVIFNNKTSNEKSINEIVGSLSKLETRLKDLINKSDTNYFQRLEDINIKLNLEIDRVRKEIPELPNINIIDDKISSLTESIRQIKTNTQTLINSAVDDLKQIIPEEETSETLVTKLQEVKRPWLSIEAIDGDFNTKVTKQFGGGNTLTTLLGVKVGSTDYGDIRNIGFTGAGVSAGYVGGLLTLTITGGGGGGTTDTWYQDEVLTRTDGTTYTLAHTPTSVLFLFLNGQKITENTDFTVSGDTITMTAPTLSSDVLTATYAVGTSVWYEETVTRTDGTNYTLAHSVTSVLFLYLNGQLIVKDVDYTLTGANITMTSPTLSTDTLTAKYQ